MNDINKKICGKCGGKIPPDAPDGMCPRCLLKLSIDQPPETRDRTGPHSLEEISSWFPHLEIVGLLGRGGMGTVYKARQIEIDRTVAVKMISRPSGQDPELTERFLREAKALAKLSHGNIVSIYDFGEIKGHCYFIMEYVEGRNLQDRIDCGNLKPEQILQIARDLCDALVYAHDKGIVHRDIKPSNILIDDNNNVKIADFGLAKIIKPDPATADLTITDQTMGTLYYMAPEQRTNPKTADHRIDIYALGVLIYEMLTGELPIGNFDPPSVKSGCSRTFDNMVLKALNSDPAKRYQRASEMKSAIEKIKRTSSYAPGRKRIITVLSVLCLGIILAAVIAGKAEHIPRIPPGAKEFEGNFYALFPDNIDWHSAEKQCRRKGGHLAVITSRAEADFVAGLSRCHAWIGAADERNEGQWMWVTGERMDFSLWETGEPNNADLAEHYLMISKYGFWNDFPASSDRIEGYICEWESTNILKPITTRKDLHRTLKIFNAKYNNRATCRHEDGKIEEIGLVRTGVQTILPLKGLPLKNLNLSLTDVSDLSPLKGMPLRHLDISHSKVHDLSPLKGMPLQELHMNCLNINDISALEGMPLKKLGMLDTSVTDITPLAGCTTLESIDIPVTVQNFELLKSLPNLKTINNQKITN